MRVSSFFRFINIKNKKEVKVKLDKFLSTKALKGTILISNEGVNGSISGKHSDLKDFFKILKNYLRSEI